MIIFFFIFNLFNLEDNCRIDSLLDKGLFYYELSEKFEDNPQKCFHYTFLSSDCFKQGSLHREYIHSLMSISSLFFYESNLDSAIHYDSLALNTAKLYLNPGDIIFIKLYNNIGFDYSYSGNLELAEFYLTKALKLSLFYKEDIFKLIDIYNNLIVVNRKKGEYGKSISLLKQLIKGNYIKDKELLANYYLSLSKLSFQIKDYENSLIEAEKSILLFKEMNSDGIQKASLQYLRLLNYVPEKEGSLTPEIIDKNINLESKEIKTFFRFIEAERFYLSSNYNQSILSLLNAKECIQKVEFPDKVFLNLNIEILLAKNYSAKYEFHKSNFHLNEAQKKLFSSNTLNGNFKDILQEIRSVEIINHFYEALEEENFDKFQTLLLKYLGNLKRTLIDLNYSEISSSIYLETYNDVLSLISNSNLDLPITHTFAIYEANKSLSLAIGRSNRSKLSDFQFANSEFPNEKELPYRISYYKRIIKDEELKPDSLKNLELFDWKKKLIKLETEFDDFKRMVRYNQENLENIIYEDVSLDLESFKLNLKNHEAVLQYYVVDSTIHQLFINSDTSILTSVKEIVSFNLLLDTTVSTKLKTNLLENQLKNIYNKLFIDIELNLNHVQNLIIIPDGFLHQLPFEILMNEEGEYLIENFNVEYQYSATLMYMLDQNNEQDKSVDGFAGFAYSSDSAVLAEERSCNQSYSFDLLCSEKEVNQVSNILVKKDTPFNRTKSEFINNASNKSIIHLSTHACSDPEDYNLSRIYFEDDYITTYEISALNLNSDLAVLSACDTGSGAISKGEGVMSLAKSFFYAGCKSAIVSLWPVDDCSTSEIMVNFYKHLKSGKTKDNSLRLAKLDYLKSAHPERKAPYFWAGFILVGNNDPLFSNDFNPWLWITGSLILMGIAFFFYSKNKKLRSETQKN